MVQPNQYGTEQIQDELLDLMKIFHNFCEKEGIQYFLYGGSCLGAVRHKGFIPWDDDLDICVDRINYNKLVKSFQKCDELKMYKTIWIYRIQKKEAKAIQGYIPTLDVFVNDNVPDNPFRFRMKLFRLSALQGMLKEEVVYKGFSFKNKVLLFTTHMLGKLFSTEFLRKRYDAVSQIGNEKETKCVHCSNVFYRWIRNKYPSDTWKDAVLTDFEDAKFYIPQKYDVYLTICYGDYMKLPAEEDRKPEHVK